MTHSLILIYLYLDIYVCFYFILNLLPKVLFVKAET